MSGGSFDYVFSRVYDFGDELQRNIDNNKTPDKWGDCTNYSNETISELKKIADEAKVLSTKMHSVEWLYSGDYGEANFMEEVKNADKL